MTNSPHLQPPLPRVLFVSAEIFPLAKTGGLADVSAALPAALSKDGLDVRLMLPGYSQALDLVEGKKTVASFDDGLLSGRLIEGRMPDTKLLVYLYDDPALYRRAGTLYQDEGGRDWSDNHLRYAHLCHAAAHIGSGIKALNWTPDIVHANDWHTGLLPALLAMRKGRRPASVFTIHNMAFQGNFPLSVASELNVPPELLTSDGMEFYGQLSFLKAGLRYGDRLTTVSPNYAQEILTPKYGCGLDGLLRARSRDLTGILNGVDYEIWDPAIDPVLAQRYAAGDMAGKKTCKAAIQEAFGLERSDKPLLIYVNRLTQQKMADVLLNALPAVLSQDTQIVLHGQGDKSLENAFIEATRGKEGQFAVRIGYEETLARRLNAAADFSLTPSRFEPCGLTTMYAMRYGALPVTRAVGGLADTVVDPDSSGAEEHGGTGFLFEDETPQAMSGCIERATRWFRRDDWGSLQNSAMKRNFGWKYSAKRYLDVYRHLHKPERAVGWVTPALFRANSRSVAA
jgi:starch synthase